MIQSESLNFFEIMIMCDKNVQKQNCIALFQFNGKFNIAVTAVCLEQKTYLQVEYVYHCCLCLIFDQLMAPTQGEQNYTETSLWDEGVGDKVLQRK